MKGEDRTPGALRYVLREDELAPLLAEILDFKRSKPIVVLTAARHDPLIAISPCRVEERVGGKAAIWCVPSSAVTWNLNQLCAGYGNPANQIEVPFNGAAIVWWPLKADGSTKLSSRLVLDKSGRYGIDHVEEIVAILDAGPEQADRSNSELRLREELEEERRRRKASDREAREQRIRADEFRDQLRDMRMQVKKLKNQNRHSSDQASAEAITSFESEVADFWVKNLKQPGRPLMSFSLGPKFEKSVEALELAAREQIVRAVAYLVCGMGESLSDHPLRTGSGGNDPQRVRESDGARAYRCAIKRDSPGAPRLHYWRTGEGHTELSLAVVHENYAIR